MSKSKDIGNAGERNHRLILAVAFPDIVRYPDRYHPTRDHDNTGSWHIESKKRNTWNIKDVVRDMENGVPIHTPWAIMYEDRDRRKKENPSGVYGVVPGDLLARLIDAADAQEW